MKKITLIASTFIVSGGIFIGGSALGAMLVFPKHVKPEEKNQIMVVEKQEETEVKSPAEITPVKKTEVKSPAEIDPLEIRLRAIEYRLYILENK
jgi:hypothetical protein